MLHEMNVKGLTFDPLTNTPIVVLRDVNETTHLPIWVGVAEANAIALELENITSPRPMTHDLLRHILDRVDAVVTGVTITELREGTYIAEIGLSVGEMTLNVDSRPSDAIAIALRTKAQIFVADEVLKTAKTQHEDAPWEEADELKEWLEEITPEDFSAEL